MAFKASVDGLPRVFRQFFDAHRGVAVWFLKVQRAARRAGQVTVELLLVLPVFMTMLFFIMELGNLAFQTILVHHCAYELARIGSLVAGPPGGSTAAADCGRAQSKMDSVKANMFAGAGQIQLNATCVATGKAPEDPRINEDLLATLTYPARLVFPVSSYFFADEPKGRRIKNITARVRMPIEKPFFQ